jgi:hypothetical protein
MQVIVKYSKYLADAEKVYIVYLATLNFFSCVVVAVFVAILTGSWQNFG